MKNYTKRILAGLTVIVLAFGIFAETVAAADVEKPEEEIRAMPIYVENIDTKEPVSGLYLMLKAPKDAQTEDIIFDEPTDENGRVTYEPLTIKSGVTYTLQSADEDVEVGPKVTVTGGRKYFGNYIAAVNGEVYDGTLITLYAIDDRSDIPVQSEITSISSSINEVGEEGGSTAITVTGKNLPETAYCQLWLETENGSQDKVGSLQTVTMTGNASEREFTVEIPSSSGYEGAAKWIVRVSLDAKGTQGWDAAAITINK